ncbi:MAG: PKD domain-containing protein [Chitinophagaceae bacterium]|nr:PKD domain-containing protein [Chitinophagaceae bacterium]
MYRNKSNYAGYPLGYPVKYIDKWMLAKIEDTKGNSIDYNYGAYTIANPTISGKYSYKEVKILKPNGGGNFTEKKLYGITTSRSDWRLQSISITTLGPGVTNPSLGSLSTATVVQFGWGGNTSSTEDTRLLTIGLPLEKKNYELLYTIKFTASPTTWNGFGRYFLKGLKATTSNNLCDNVHTQFDFTYYDVNQANNTCYCTPLVLGSTSIKLDTLINAQDYWGYYNGQVGNETLNPNLHVYPDNPNVELFKIYQIPSYSGAYVPISFLSNRTVSTNGHTQSGSLKTITSPSGGITELVYENNEFFDYDLNSNVKGGGIRIKKITNYDGMGTTPDVTEYNYNDPSNTSITTGRAISVPKFALAFQNSNSYGGNITNKVLNSTYVTTYDLNNEPKDILYGKVTVQKAGIGKSIYEYNTTGTFGSTVTVADWGNSYNYVARTNLSSPTPCVAMTPSFLYNNNGLLQYPFTSNVNFDFERGLPIKVTHKNETGSTVANEEYAYARSHTNPTKIYGVKLDEIGNTMAAYGKYAVNGVVDNFMVTKTSRLYNSNSSTPITDVENYVYTSPGSSDPYRLLKEVKKQNTSDPATTVTRYKYSNEYTATSSTTNEMNEALFKFNGDFHKNVVVETTQSRTEPGQPEKFTGASFNTFRKFTIGDIVGGGNTVVSYLPDESYQFVNQAGVTNFTYSTINSNAFVWDNTNYTNATTKIKKYNTRGIPEVVIDNSRIPKTILSTTLVTNVKVAEFTNAESNNVGYSNFDGVFSGNFTITGTASTIATGAGRYSNNCLNFQPNTIIYRSLDRQVSAKNLIISFWLKDAESSGDIYICVQKFSTCGTFSCSGASGVIPFTTGNQWKYYQFVIPWTSSLSTFCYGLSTSAAVKIDDVLIYPDNANVTTYSYTTGSLGTNMLTAKNGINGIGNAYEYDNAGRLWLVKDHFDNIIEMKKYKLTNRHPQQIPSISIGFSSQPYEVNTDVGFYAGPPFSYETGDCDAPVIVYNWNFGDGHTGVSRSIPGNRGGTTIIHQYTTAGTYQVMVTASSPGMAAIPPAYTPPASNTTAPLPVTIVGTAVPCYPGTPNICASGITHYTSTNQCNKSTCGSLPSSCDETYFTVSSISGGSGTFYSVQWETAPEGSSNWTVYQAEPPNGAAGGAITSKTFHVVHTDSYQMRARVRFCNQYGSTAYSNTILIKNGD